MAKIVLGVTGSVAAIRTPALYRALIDSGHTVRVLATEASLHFFDPDQLPPVESDVVGLPHSGPIFRDADEWGAARYERGDLVPHIEFRKWADLLLIAPLDANTLAKLALGLSDNFLTCVFRAWDFQSPVILAPAMNTLMWQSPVTHRHLHQILEDQADPTLRPIDDSWILEKASDIFAKYTPRILLIPPGVKRLACGDLGVGAMAEVITIAETVRQLAESRG